MDVALTVVLSAVVGLGTTVQTLTGSPLLGLIVMTAGLAVLLCGYLGLLALLSWYVQMLALVAWRTLSTYRRQRMNSSVVRPPTPVKW